MATHPRILAWKIPWTEESDGLQSMGLQRVGHERVTEHTASKQIAPTRQEKHQIPSDLEEPVPLRTLSTPTYLA